MDESLLLLFVRLCFTTTGLPFLDLLLEIDEPFFMLFSMGADSTLEGTWTSLSVDWVRACRCVAKGEILRSSGEMLFGEFV